MAPSSVPRAPLISLLLVGTPYKRVAVDLIGPLVKSAASFRYILVVLDYAMQFPEAIPLRRDIARTVASELVKIFAWELLLDQGMNFTFQLLREFRVLLGIKKLWMSVCHPQTDRLVERFSWTLSNMLWKNP